MFPSGMPMESKGSTQEKMLGIMPYRPSRRKTPFPDAPAVWYFRGR